MSANMNSSATYYMLSFVTAVVMASFTATLILRGTTFNELEVQLS